MTKHMNRMAVGVVAAACIASTDAAIRSIPTGPIAMAIEEYSARIAGHEAEGLIAEAAPTPEPPTTSAQGQQAPAGRISGLVFGDIYYLSQHHNEMFQGMNGLWFRRMYLTYDHRMDSQTSARVRLEAASAGNFTSTTALNPFIKDLYLQHTFAGGHRGQLGLISTPTWDMNESVLGYRHIEKTPLDLWRFASSRDQGISVKAPLAEGTTYHLLLGNNSGTGTENNKEKAAYLGHRPRADA